jgi:branched-chain amino acid transport system permease protein
MSSTDSVDAPAAPPRASVAGNPAHPPALRTVALVAVGGLAVVAFQLTGLSSELTYVATSVAIFALAATGLAVLYGECGQMSVAHGGIVGLAAYTTIYLLTHGVATGLALVLAPLIGALAALLVGLPSLRLAGHYFVITTFAAAASMTVVATNLHAVGGSAGISLPVNSSLFSHRVALYYVSFAALIVAVLVRQAIRRSRIGARLVAIRENEQLARALGVRTKRLKLVAFAVSGGACGAAGFLLAFANQYVSPADVGSAPGITLVLILVLGGSRTWLGPILGAAIYYALPYVFPVSAVTNQFVTGLVLVAVILLVPMGLVGSAASVFAGIRSRDRPWNRIS